MTETQTAARSAPVRGRDNHGSLRAWLRLLASSNMIEGEVRRRLRATYGVTLPQFDVLAQLDLAAREHPQGLTMSELSRRLMVTNGNLTGLIERLVEEKLVNRLPSATDRRMQIVRLTTAGKRALDAMTPDHEQWIQEMFSGLSPEEQGQLHALLGNLRDSVRGALSPDDES